MHVELPAVISALEILSIEMSAVERHAAVRTGIAQGKGLSHAVAADHKGNFQQHCLFQLIAIERDRPAERDTRSR